MSSAPRCFISYSHDNENHKEWVLNLATRLVKNGVDVTLDQWDL
ncbi:toll/interleukin-1 receptor domain-containing protein [Shewanella sp. JL219SE-S6]